MTLNFKTLEMEQKAAKERLTAYLDGYDAYCDGSTKCPFDYLSPAWEDWMNGYSDAEYLESMYERSSHRTSK